MLNETKPSRPRPRSRPAINNILHRPIHRVTVTLFLNSHIYAMRSGRHDVDRGVGGFASLGSSIGGIKQIND